MMKYTSQVKIITILLLFSRAFFFINILVFSMRRMFKYNIIMVNIRSLGTLNARVNKF